jgi:ADP-dependent NAD(P)H-hydrate dehydratase / NAD(P)H-hydrate epimerase
MSSVTVQQMREIEQRAMRSGISEAKLMELAGLALGRAIGNQYREVGTAVAYIGKGHNGGDALIALRVLKEEFGWQIGVRSDLKFDQWAELTQIQWDELDLDEFSVKGFEKHIHKPLLLIDGLVGIGAQGALRDSLLKMANEMNRLRNECGAIVVAVDVPSGVDPDSGEIYSGAVIADRTFMIGAAKSGLLHSHAANATGQLALVEVDVLKADIVGEMELICPQSMSFGKSPRPFDFHKGKAGRLGIVAGSSSFTGAALLSALGAIRAGAGLVTLYVRSVIYDSMISRLPMEVMLKRCDFPEQLSEENLDAIVIGPGLGEMSQDFTYGLSQLIAKPRVPTVIDADGLNFMVQHGLKTHKLHVLTPHPGEFGRLAPNLSKVDRENAARQFVEDNDAVLLLKGARTIVAKAGEPLRINSTGTPAMSNGGQGDLLSGVIGALLAGGMDAFDAAAYGAWLCGHAAELSYDAHGDVCTATDTAARLGDAMRSWRRGGR